MLGLLLGLVAHIRFFLLRTMPTNFGVLAIMSRRGLKWGIPGMLIAIPYTLAAVMCFQLVEDGWPGWWNLVGLVFIWNACKFIAVGPASLVRLLRVRRQERRSRRA